MQTYPFLQMTNGTLTVTFADGNGGQSNFAPVRGTWAVAIASRRRAALGRGPWNEVIEEWDLNIRGADAAAAMSNLETLVRLLDQADRFWRLGENVAPVILKYAPQGSTIFTTANPACCFVIGRAPGNETNLTLPAHFNDVGLYYEILGVRLRFLRTGEWLNPTAETASSSVAAIPTVQSVSLASNLAISSPANIEYHFSLAGVAGNVSSSSPSYVLVARDTSRLQIYEGEAAVYASPWNTMTDAANRARGGSIIRYSPGALVASTHWFLSGFDSTARRIAIWAAVRNNSPTTTFSLTASLRSDLGSAQAVGLPTVIDASVQTPRIVFLGILSCALAVTGLEIAATASAASGSLDIDYLVLHAVDDETSTTVALYDAMASVGTMPTPHPGYNPTVIDSRPLSATTPITTIGAAKTSILTYTGDANIMSVGNTLAAVWLGTPHATSLATYWRPGNFSVVADTAITVSRHNGYLSPR